MKIDDYIPVEIYRIAKDFIKTVDDDVSIYQKIKSIASIKTIPEADKFCAYWYLEKYEEFPHALITLYENKEDIDNSFGPCNSLNAIECIQFRFKKYYELLKENKMIEE